VELDLIEHRLIVRSSEGRIEQMPLESAPICDFYRGVMRMLSSIGVEVSINPKPFKCKSTIPFAEDRVHASYDREAVQRAFTSLQLIAPVFTAFRGRFLGKSSPVHMFWHSFDLAVTRFSGRRAPDLPGADSVTREAYSHEVNSAGFWFGDDSVPEPAFYGYTAPAPAGLTSEPLAPSEAGWSTSGDAPLALLKYDDLRRSAEPSATLLAFLQSSYDAGARRASWNPELIH
jgi:hypothetical protein